MSSYKALNRLISILMVLSLLFNGSVGIIQASAQGASNAVAPSTTSAMPINPTDETKVPHYFGPYSNWANSPFTLPDVNVQISGGGGSGATASATVGANGAITGITITNPGSGYTSAPSVVFNTSNGTGAAAVATVSATGAVTSIIVPTDGGGSGYTSPIATIDPGGLGNATATVYGGVNAITIDPGAAGSGYTMPTVDINLPDDPNGVQARAHAELGANGSISAIFVDNPGSGYSKAPQVVIRDGTVFDPINGGTGATATATLTVQAVVLDTFGSGYTSAPAVVITDSAGGTGSGALATAFTDFGAVTNIQLTNPGSGYVTPGGIKKFQDDLPGLCTPPNCTATKYIPLAVPEAKVYDNGVKAIEADEYVIGVVQYRTSFSSSLPDTLVRGYVQIETAANRNISQHYPLTNANLDPTVPASPVLINGVQAYGVTPPQWLGPIIAATKNKPVRIVFHNLLPTGSDGDLFLPTDTSMMGSGMGPMPMADPMNDGTVMDEVRNPPCTDAKGMGCFKDNRATLHLHGGTTPWISDGTAHQWITPAGEMTDWPQGVSVSNVPDMLENPGNPNSPVLCDANDDGCQTFYYTNQQSARLLFYHDHSWGITRLNVYAGEAAGYLISDDTESKLFGAAGLFPDLGLGTPLVVQDRTFVPDTMQLYGDPANGVYGQDPTWDAARWGSKGSFWYHHVYMPAQNPGDPSGMSAYGRWMYGPWFWPPAAGTTYGPIDNPYYDPKCKLDDPQTWQYPTDPFCEPQQIPGTPNISVGMEQFNDTPIVNGVAYPKVTLEPKSYRFRMLNAANDRFFNFQWYVADPRTGTLSEVALKQSELDAAQTDPNVFPTPDTTISAPGPDWIQIGTEGGFLPAPVVVDGQQPITWIIDPTRFDFGNGDKHSLLLAPAERADVIVDFSQFAGKTLILYNDAPAAFPARVASYDYYTGAPDLSPVGAPTILPGYGPNTRTIMQVTIAGNAAPAFDLTKLRNAFKHNVSGTGVFESGQHPIIVGQAAYNSAYGTNFAASSNCNAPGSTLQRCDGFVRVSDTKDFGFNTLRAPNAKMTMQLQPKAIHDEMNSTTFDEYGRMQANLGVEAQPPTPGLQNVTLYPFVNPATELIDGTNLPTPNITYVNGAPANDFKVTPIGSANDGTQIWRITHNGVDTHPIHFHLYDVQLVNRVTWDNIIIPADPTELGWKDTVRVSPLEDTIVALRPIIPEVPFEVPNAVRMLNPMMPEGSDKMFNNVLPNGNPPSSNITNQFVNFGWEYVYHCHILSHEEMDMMRPVSVALPPNKPTWSVPNAYTTNGNSLTLYWEDNSITETAFVVQRMDSSLTWETLTTIQSPLDPNIRPRDPNIPPNVHGPRSYTDNTYVDGQSYQYRVIAQNTVGYGNQFPTLTVQSMTDILLIGNAFPPDAPTALTAAVVAGPKVQLQWTDNATTETNFAIERAPVTNSVIGTFGLIGAVGANVTTYTDPTVSGNTVDTTYAYRVYAYNGAGNSLPTNPPVTVVVPAPPFVSSIVRTSLNPTGAATVNYTVTFSKAVTGVDANDFAFALTGTVAGTSVKSISGSGKTYTVVVNTGSGTGTLGLNLSDNDTIIDALSNPLGGTGSGNGNFTGQLYDLNRTVPTVVSIAAASVNPTNAASVTYTVTFTEAVTGVDKTDFALALSGITGTSITNVTSVDGITYTVSVNTGSGSGTLGLNLVDNDSIKNAVNNPLAGVGAGNGNFTGEIYTLDKTAPTVSSIVRASSNPIVTPTVNYTVTFSEPVVGVDINDFTLTITGNNTGGSIASVSQPEPILQPTVYTVVINVGVGGSNLHLDLLSGNVSIADLVGNALGGLPFTGQVYDIDTTPPTISSIVLASANPTKATTVNYTVTFSEPVTGVDTGDFALALSGVTSPSVASVTQADLTQTVFTVVVNTGSGSGTLRLDTITSASIVDMAGNNIGSAPFTGGDVYNIDKTPPTVLSIVRASQNPTGAGNVNYTVTFSEPVTGVDETDFVSNASAGITGFSVTKVTPVSATVYTVTVNTGSGYGTLGLDLVDDDTIIDALSTPLGGIGLGNGNFTGSLYTIEPGVGIYDDATTAVWSYSGTWSTYNGNGPYNNTLHQTNVAGNYAEVTFSGVKFKLTYLKAAGRGSMDVYIDGTKVTTINANGTLTWQATWTSQTLSAGVHTVRFQNVSNAWIDLDAIQIFAAPTPVGTGIYDDTNAAWSYSGTWSTYNGTGPYNNTLHQTNVAGNSAEITFSGVKFTLTYLKSSGRGSMDVYIDGTKVTTIDANGTLTWQATWTSQTLSAGVHTVRIQNISNAWIDLDAIQILAAPTPVGTGTYDDTNAAWSYSGTWSTYNGNGPYNNTLHQTNVAGNSAEITFSGVKFTLTYLKAAGRGSMDVYIDGTKVTTIDANGTLTWQATWPSQTLSAGVHTVRIQNVSNTWIDLDAITIQ